MVYKRAVLIILDSLGIGAAPDCQCFGDHNCNTLGNMADAVGGLKLPCLQALGLGNIAFIRGVEPSPAPQASFGKMQERSAGKDTTTGHWEMMGIVLDSPFPTYPEGFPPELIAEYERRIGRKTLGNVVASGTEIIARLGQEHMNTGFPIVYTSADSVFQIAAHEEVIPLDRLYEICMTAREILTGEHAVGRVIARPFVGSDGNFTRTSNRRDFSLEPPGKTLLDHVKEAGMEVKAVGKIEDIYAGRGITEAVHISGNMDGVDKTLEFMQRRFDGLIFTNLVDFDMHFGHRNDPEGYARALKEFDDRLPEILHELDEQDILFITADHGCDPTTGSTDHSREYVPLLAYGKRIGSGKNLGIRSTFSDLAQTAAEILGVAGDFDAVSFYNEIR